MGARHTCRWLVGCDPVDKGAEVPDQALVYAASRHLLGPVLVHQLAGQHHAVVRAWRSAEGIHVHADERVVGTERRASGDADDQHVGVLGHYELGHAGQDRVAAAEQDWVVGTVGHVVVACGPLGLLLVQQGVVFGMVVLVCAGRRRYLVWVMDLEPDRPLAGSFAGQEFR